MAKGTKTNVFNLRDGKEFIMNDVEKLGYDSWYVVKTEKYRPDREKFIVGAFKERFPGMKASTINEVGALASRSTVVRIWLAGISVQYAESVAPPFYLQGAITNDEYKVVSDQISELNSLYKKEALEAQEAAAEYKEKLSKIQQKYQKARDEVGPTDITRIIALPSTELPLSLQEAIENFTPDQNKGITRDKFGREMLIEYKLALVKYLRENPETDLDSLLAELAEK